MISIAEWIELVMAILSGWNRRQPGMNSGSILLGVPNGRCSFWGYFGAILFDLFLLNLNNNISKIDGGGSRIRTHGPSGLRFSRPLP
jgi:hypothetical protein